MRASTPWQFLVAAMLTSCGYDFDAPFSPEEKVDGSADSPTDALPGDVGESGDANDAKDGDGIAPEDAPSDAPVDKPTPSDAPDVQDASCPPGTKDCEGSCVPVSNPATGCDSEDCAPCTFAHGEALCIAGACALGACENNWGNCDGNENNGCETNLRTTIEHCGACGAACTFPNATGECASSNCSFQACNDGYHNCNTDVLDGCEVATSYNDDNCGSCGNVCHPDFHCNNTACRCSDDGDCDTGAGGTCVATYSMCDCPNSGGLCSGPCTASGVCSL